MNKFVPGVILLVMCSGLSSCSFHWHATGKNAKNHDKTTSDTIETAIVPAVVTPGKDTTAPHASVFTAPVTSGPEKQLIDQLTPLLNARIDYRTFSGKAKVHFSGPDNDIQFTAHFRIRKDSVIWVNVTYDAFPVARLFITRDSFFLLNTKDQEITRIPLSQAAKILPTKVDFTSLQNLVTGEPLRKGTITNAASAGDSIAIDVEDSNYVQHITFNKADSTIRTGQLRTRDPKGPQAATTYNSYEMINNRKISTYRTLNVLKGNEVYILDMNFTKTDFDEELTFPFSIPSSYTEKR
jgi:hypothetical protein